MHIEKASTSKKTAKKGPQRSNHVKTSRGSQGADHGDQQVLLLHDHHEVASEYTASKITVILHVNDKSVTFEFD